MQQQMLKQHVITWLMLIWLKEKLICYFCDHLERLKTSFQIRNRIVDRDKLTDLSLSFLRTPSKTITHTHMHTLSLFNTYLHTFSL